MEKIQLIGSSSPYESNRASPTTGRRPLTFNKDLMVLLLSLSVCNILSDEKMGVSFKIAAGPRQRSP
jgi:hypothetical protein